MAWNVVPEEEKLTEERIKTAIECGISSKMEIQDVWNIFSTYQFKVQRKSVDLTWKNWCFKHVAIKNLNFKPEVVNVLRNEIKRKHSAITSRKTADMTTSPSLIKRMSELVARMRKDDI